LRIWMRNGQVNPTLIHLLQYFWFSWGISLFFDWHFIDGYHYFTWSLCSIYIFSRQISSAPIFFATHLACLCLGCMDEKNHRLFRGSTSTSH
jgi:hypothetical protein